VTTPPESPNRARAGQPAHGRPRLERRRVGWFRQVGLIARKDLAIELSTGEIITTSGFFAVLVAVIASLAFFAGAGAAQAVAPGVIWVAVAFSSVLALSRTWQREREDGALLGLLVTPLDRSAIFAGKALGVAVFITAIELIVIPVTALFFSIDLVKFGPGLVLLTLAATPGIAASGTLFGAMTARTRARDLVLASVLFPLLAPCLLAAVAGTRALFGGAPVSELTDYVELMAMFGFIFGAGGLAMFGALMDS
jgi:heme exporter protein B